MTDSIIRVENLGKKYILGHQPQGVSKYSTLRDTLANAGKSLWQSFRRPQAQHKIHQEEFWALQDVSFEVKQGECVGIIGRNGAGKSTLLKILSRITEPTRGRIEIGGRVASLLEVGTGFHPELTGRENIYLNGAVLGMTRQEIRRKFTEIVEFAEVERFLDTPVKRYSSGMYVRLAFAVAAHLEPEILVVDEVLAVGDINFQKKCLGKMGDVAPQEGRTILFVSHNMTAVQSLCSRSIWLNQGQLIDMGESAKVVNMYLESSISRNREKPYVNQNSNSFSKDKLCLRSVRLINASGKIVNQVPLEDPLIIEVEYQVLQSGIRLNLSLSLFTIENIYVLASPSWTDSNWFQKPHPEGIYRSRCLIPGYFLNYGMYYITLVIVENGSEVIFQEDHILNIEVLDSEHGRNGWFGYWGGVVRPSLQWETIKH